MSFITKMFGGKTPDTSQAQYTPANVTGPTGGVNWSGGNATLTLSDALKQLYDQYVSGASSTLPSPEQLDFGNQVSNYGKGMFSNASKMNLNEMIAKYYNQQQDIMAPGREAENVSLANTLFSQGRTGAGVGVSGGGYINPEQFSLFKARGLADQNLAFESTNRARGIQMEDIQKALGLYGMGQSFKTEPYGVSAGILGNAMNLGQSNASFIPYGIQSGSAGANAGANILNAETSARNANLGFWGNLGSAFLKK